MRIEQRHINGYTQLLVNRADTYAQQLRDGSYVRRNEPVTRETVAAHLEGRITAGWYALGMDSTARWAVLDADQADGLARLQHCFLALDKLGVPAHLERSRRGGHLWVFFEEPVPGEGARQLMQRAVPAAAELELYPKQLQLPSHRSVGSLVRGPLGVHALSGNRYPFVDPVSLRPVSGTALGTVDYLLRADRLTVQHAVGLVTILQAEYQESAAPRTVFDTSRRSGERQSPIVELKERIGDPKAFVGRYVPLDASGKGPCPFHPPDQHPSFAVNPRTGRFTDFHTWDSSTKRYTSGDVIDFYAAYHGISLREALHRLIEEYR